MKKVIVIHFYISAFHHRTVPEQEVVYSQAILKYNLNETFVADLLLFVCAYSDALILRIVSFAELDHNLMNPALKGN